MVKPRTRLCLKKQTQEQDLEEAHDRVLFEKLHNRMQKMIKERYLYKKLLDDCLFLLSTMSQNKEEERRSDDVNRSMLVSRIERVFEKLGQP